ncbi:C40 family peptidase [Polynucleobacter sp. es-MAR-4]|uniref:C40 family peptidase n=1 Tax=Polynucleobacter sp. es-MAR-4 TaxID=1855655 RepID=UPI001C0C9BEF|nr:C40 family peptidase [Polynucleobacter sp. es-MAR-4]MBU3636722.1 C40 family peptidase [Polynucleobacter sp. es-MAR-4]
MLLTHSKQSPSCRTLIGCGIFIISLLTLGGCSTFSGKSGASRVTQFKQDTSVGTEDISIAAVGLVGVPYRYGGNNPKAGFDCSGLIVYVYNKSANIKLPRTIQEMSNRGQSVDNGPPAPGDLVFFNTTGAKYSHAGIYVGQGRFVHAPSAGGTVRLEYITTPYWAARFTEARRLTTAN